MVESTCLRYIVLNTDLNHTWQLKEKSGGSPKSKESDTRRLCHKYLVQGPKHFQQLEP
jgi:hypothetical protein